MILLILVSIPIFNSTTWFSPSTTYTRGMENVIMFKNNTSQFDTQANLFISQTLQLPEPLVYFEIYFNATCCQFPKDFPQYSSKNLETIRADSIYPILFGDTDLVVFDQTNTNILSSQLNIGRTLFVCVLLIASTLLFSRDI